METGIVTLDQVLNSKIYVHEKSQLTFGSPRSFLEPFLEKLVNSRVTFKVSVSDRVANKDASTDAINEAFGRVLIEAKFPSEYSVNEHDHVIGMVYALDTLKPTLKIYSGENAWACTNLAIFGAKYIHQVEVLQGIGSVYDKSLEYIEGVSTQLAKFQKIYEQMNDTQYEGEDINKMIGYLLREGYRNKNLGINPVLSATKDLDDNKSRYAIRDNRTSQWNMYSALTQYVTDKVDILDKSSKTVMLSNLFVKDL